MCPQCGKTFALRSCLNAHQNVHKEDKRIKCKLCDVMIDYKCKRAHWVAEHCNEYQNIVRDRKIQVNVCLICGKMLRSGLASHMKTHSSETFYECEICGQKFKHANARTRHREIHKADRSYKCSICSKTFLSNQYLKQHEKLHSGIKPFSCKICGKAFLLNYRVTQHMKRAHSDQGSKITDTPNLS